MRDIGTLIKKLKKTALICNFIGYITLVLGVLSLLLFVLDFIVAGVLCPLVFFAVSVNAFRFKAAYAGAITQKLEYYINSISNKNPIKVKPD